jgi:hypothetical protein
MYTYDISIYQSSKNPDTSSGRPGRLRIPGLVKKLGLLGITIEEAESLFDIMDVNHSALAPFELLRKSMAETGRKIGEHATVGNGHKIDRWGIHGPPKMVILAIFMDKIDTIGPTGT